MDVKDFLNNPDRDEIALKLKRDKTPVQQLLYYARIQLRGKRNELSFF